MLGFGGGEANVEGEGLLPVTAGLGRVSGGEAELGNEALAGQFLAQALQVGQLLLVCLHEPRKLHSGEAQNCTAVKSLQCKA